MTNLAIKNIENSTKPLQHYNYFGIENSLKSSLSFYRASLPSPPSDFEGSQDI
jgi:hypothetical protein